MLDIPNTLSDAKRITQRISNVELIRRTNSLRDAMRIQNIDALVMQSQNDWLGGYVRWLTDIPAQNGYPRSVVFHVDAPMTVVEMGAAGVVRNLNAEDELHRYVGNLFGCPSFLSVNFTHGYDAQLIVDDLRRHSYQRVGLVGLGAMPSKFVEVLRSALAGHCTLVDATDLVDEIKAVKSPEEIELLQAAAELQDRVFDQVLEVIKPGMRDIDVTTMAQAFGQSHGSEQGIFLGSSSPVGQRSTFLGRHMQGRVLRPGDHLSLLIEINGPGGFYTELARTIVLGRASLELQEGFASVLEAQNHTLNLIKPGASCADIAAAHDAYMMSNGMPAERRLYAHGQGYDMVERPLIRHDETMALAENMCLAIHPGYETDEMFSVVCDNYLVTKSGVSLCLHQTEKKFLKKSRVFLILHKIHNNQVRRLACI